MDEADMLLLARFMNLLMQYEGFSDEKLLISGEFSSSELGTPEDSGNSISGAMHVDSIRLVLDPNTEIDQNEIFDYTLPSWPLTSDMVPRISSVYRQGGKLSRKSVHSIMKVMYNQITKMPNIYDVQF